MNHATLLAMLPSEFGVTDTPLSWIESYLSGRSFLIRVGQSSAPVTQAISEVRQGSVPGPIFFTTYEAPIGRLINSYDINNYKYADETQLYTALVKPHRNNMQRFEPCTAGFQHCFFENDLLLIPDNSEVCFVGTGQKLARTPLPTTVIVAGCLITVSDKLKTSVVTLDADLTFENYVNHVAKAFNFHLWSLRHIRGIISRDVADTMTACTVGTRLDYCNAMLHCATEKSLNKLQ